MGTSQSGSSKLDKLLEASQRTPFDEAKVPSASQPLPDVFRQRAQQVRRRFTNERRVKSIKQPKLPVSLDGTELKNLRQGVFDVVKLRLQHRGVSITTIPESFFAWMLPKNNANAADWNLLINNPVLLSNVQLGKMFNMVSSAGPKEAEPGEVLFYMRTFAFTLEELTELIQAMFEEGFGSHDTPYVLWELIQDLDPVADAGSTIFVRYCGTTTEGSAWDRHEHDLRNSYTTMKSIFFKICQRLFPHIMAAVELHEFPDATLLTGGLDSHKQHIVDIREQAMIALLGPSTLLNTAKGGLHTQFVAHEEDNAVIAGLSTSLLQKLPGYNEQCQNLDLIRRYSQEAQDYAQSNPATTNTARYPIDNAVKDVIYNSAVPALVGGYCLMVTIGSDLTPDSIEDLKPWYKGGFESADLLISMFNEIAKVELGFPSMQSSFVADMYDANQLPFVDLYPWAKKEASDLDKALELLRKYLQAVKPIIVLTLGGLVSGVATGSFHQQHGIKAARINQVLGTLLPSKFDEAVADKDDDNCCVVIPCFHPGSVRQSAVRGEFSVRIIQMTLAVVWLAMDVAYSLAHEGDLSKREICQEVVKRVNAKTGPATEFGKRMQKLKDQYLETHATVRRMLTTDARDKLSQAGKGKKVATDLPKSGADVASGTDLLARPKSQGKKATLGQHGDITVIKTTRVRWRRALEQLGLVCDCDMADGDPNRPTRRQQVERLMSLSLGGLYGANSGKTEDDVRNWLLKVPKDTLYFFAANSITEQVEEIPDFISLFLEESVDAEDDEWKDNQEACQQASTKGQAWLTQSITKQRTSSREAASIARESFYSLLKKSDPDLAESMKQESTKAARAFQQLFQQNGDEVQIRPGNVLLLKWQSDGKDYDIKDFRLPAGCVPFIPGDTRHLFMIPEGLDIKDSSGRSLGTGRGRDIALSIHNLVSICALHPLGPQFLKL
ncbi:hypothetical protein PV11_03312 [Exophiala sideris]|uniref:Uncharacterized protein n=1 Tax=Exophiala sideris TaxID=1016849 RepID=A0A0D1WG89_9EURO|nr:hypothetical protein PV11_03312 [Exophiala sideris]